MSSSYPPPWEIWHVGRVRQAKLTTEIKTLSTTCTQTCNRQHIVHCPVHYPALLTVMRSAYVTNPDPRDWFAGRTEFIAEIDAMLEAAEQGKTDLPSITTRIAAERKIWANFTLHPGAFTADMDKDMLDHVAVERAKLATKTDEEVADVAAKVSNSADLAVAYEDFFMGMSDEKKAKYLTILKGGKSVRDVIQVMIHDEKKTKAATTSLAADRKRLEGELAKLQRAKAARDLQKEKKQKAVDKERKAQAMKLPPCPVCEKDNVSVEGCCPCMLCFTYFAYGIPTDLSFCCSVGCAEKWMPQHRATSHLCTSGSRCISAAETPTVRPHSPTTTPNPTTSTTSPSVQPTSPTTTTTSAVFCRECLLIHSNPTIFCSPTCYRTSFQSHRETIHLPRRKPEDRSSDEGMLDKINFTTYTAKNILEHVVTRQEARGVALEKMGWVSGGGLGDGGKRKNEVGHSKEAGGGRGKGKEGGKEGKVNGEDEDVEMTVEEEGEIMEGKETTTAAAGEGVQVKNE